MTMTKQNFIILLEETLVLAKKRLEQEQTSMWVSIINQLNDIRLNVVEKYAFNDWEEIHDRYTLGNIAARQLSDDDDLQQRLFSIFWGAVHWNELQ